MHKFQTWLGFAVLALLLAACAKAPAPTAAPTAPTAPPVAVVQPTATASVDYCLQCHTDKDQLIQTAKPEEEAIIESEGTG